MDKDKKEQRANYILLIIGCSLLIGLLFIYREGTTWFTSILWPYVSVVSWIVIGVSLSIALALQYYLLMLLRYSVIKYFVFWFIPILWLFNNGIVAMHRFLNWTTDIVSPVGWIPIGDLVGCLLGVIYFPLLLIGGVIVAIIDSSSAMLTQACYYARIAMDFTNTSSSDIISYSLTSCKVLWDIAANFFIQEMTAQHISNRQFLEFDLSNIFSLPYWVLGIGYSFTCIVT